MSHKLDQTSKKRKGVELFSDLMLMKFKPRSPSSFKRTTDKSPSRLRIYGSPTGACRGKEKGADQRSNRIVYLQTASREAVIVGNERQLDMINLDGLTNGFVDTFHYWSLALPTPILDLRVNPKKQIMLILTEKGLQLYSYDSLHRQHSSPQLLGSLQLTQKVRFFQFPTIDLIAVFYETHFQLYSLNDSNAMEKQEERPYGVPAELAIFAVPQGVDGTMNVFFSEEGVRRGVFGLWCLEVGLGTEGAKTQPVYKIYDIMNSLRPVLRLQNYSNDIVFLSLGQEILAARKGYILDSVSINFQVDQSYLKYMPERQVLAHVEKNMMELYSFKINLTVKPHRIELASLDSIQIAAPRKNLRLLGLLPAFDNNFALFYEQVSPLTSRGQLFYRFMVSFTVGVQQKVSQVLRGGVEVGDQALEQKCDILRKIGLREQQIYLQVWRRSGRSSVRDFQYLLSTGHYKTIKTQIQNKLRKTSMSFKQVCRVQQSCLQILRNRVASEQCGEQDLKDFLTCHLLVRKLNLHKELQLLANPQLVLQERIFYINIQDYCTLKEAELKQLVLARIAAYLFTNKGTALEIRLILQHFRFVYRYIYRELVEDMLKLAKGEVVRLLEAVPELLPPDEEGEALSAGVWQEIGEWEWQHSLYLQKIDNIYSRRFLDELVKGVWFKRNWLTLHDMLPVTCSEIRARNARNNSFDIFYFFIAKLLQNVEEQPTLKQTLSHLENTYRRFPDHLRNQVLLYSKLFTYMNTQKVLPKRFQSNFEEFLTLRDFDLFRLFFDLEKVRKNCLLKQIYPIYASVTEEGGKGFNNSLCNYFGSPISKISDLKYLLNRINNEKKQFHETHESMYAVLVKAMQMKLRLGSEHDISIDEVLIYIENIPVGIHENKEMIHELQAIQKISYESETFKKMRIDMSIREIMDNYELVMEKLVEYEIQKYDVLKLNNRAEVVGRSYRVLAEIQSVKNNVYGASYDELAFFIYLTRLMEHEQKLCQARELLSDQYINNYYFIDVHITENLVRYMYKWCFSQKASFPHNQTYIQELLKFLPEDNQFRLFAQEQLTFALLLSSNNEQVTYPLSTESHYPRMSELEELVRCLDADSLKHLRVEEVIQSMRKLQDLSKCMAGELPSGILKPNGALKSSIYSERVDDHLAHEIVIKAFIGKGLIKEALPLIRRSIESTTHYDSITILILIYAILPEIIEECRSYIVKLASLLYVHPLRLLEVVERLLGSKFTGLEAVHFLKEEYERAREIEINFNPENLVFNVYFAHLSQEGTSQRNKGVLVENALLRLKKTKPEFTHDFLFDFLYIILCYEPYDFAIFLKYVESYKYKLIRSFISHLIQEEIFDELNLLQAMKRVFFFVLKSLRDGVDIYQVVIQYEQFSLVEEFRCKHYEDMNQFQLKIQKNVAAFEGKKSKIIGLSRSQRMKQKKYIIVDKEASIKKSIKEISSSQDKKDKGKEHKDDKDHKETNQYVFTDSDDDHNIEDPEKSQPIFDRRKEKQSKIVFDPKSQRKKFYKGQKKSQNEMRKSREQSGQLGVKGIQQLQREMQQQNTKVKKYFSMDVRSGYDNDEEYMKQLNSLSRPMNYDTSRKASYDAFGELAEGRRDSVDQPRSPKLLNIVNRQNRAKTPEVQSQKQSISKSIKKSLLKNLDSNEIPSIFQLKLSNKKSEEEKSQKQSKSHKSEKSVKAVPNEKQEKEPDLQLQSVALSLLKRLYKTYNGRLEAQPYNLKVFTAQKSQNKKNFLQVLRKSIQLIFNSPDKTFEVSLRLIVQLAKKYPESLVNVGYVETYHRVAKLQEKYGFDLPMQELLPLRGIYLLTSSSEELFESIKDNLVVLSNHENILKIAKLISIGFRRNTLEQELIVTYLESLVGRVGEGEEEAELQKIKGLLNKLQIRLLIDRAEGVIKCASNSQVRTRLVGLFVEAIRQKGNGKEAKELAARFK